MRREKLRLKAELLRKSGKSYREIQNGLNVRIPKSTMSFWFRSIRLTGIQKKNIEKRIEKIRQEARETAWRVNKKKRSDYLESLRSKNIFLRKELNNINTAKITLASLYLAEGFKNRPGSLTFGNSDPLITLLFLRLLRFCYKIDESKFRCTVQCRADQDTVNLDKFWSKITKISPTQFYKARIDPRTIGKKTKKKEYKGVCRIDYFSANIYNELTVIGKIISG